METEIFLALRYLFRGQARHISFISIVSSIGIMLGVATLIIVMSVMNGFDRDLMEKLLRFNDHLTIETFHSSIPKDFINTLRGIEGVDHVSYYVQTQIFGKFDNYIYPLVVRGIDFSDKKEVSLFRRYIIQENNSDKGFYLGEGVKDKFFVGDTFTYYPLARSLKLREENVRGIFRIGLYDIDSNFVIGDINQVKQLGNNYFQYIGIRIDDPFRSAEIKKRIMNLPYQGYIIVNTWIETNHVLFSALKLEKIAMFIILSLIVLVASFNIFATISVKVVEKTKDIGILKSLGFTSRKILSIFTLQGIILGFIGVILGTGLGMMACHLLEKYRFIHLPKEIYPIEFLSVAFNTKDILMIAVVGIILSFLSSIVPAIRASRLSPCRALRYE